ncbi:SH2 domain-containing protein A [Sesamum angolense]|uniref:SH2 domain-containing protein A n=1 Tax=Sesamum angolense TaxID=2727404 RepID=A0AAE2BUH3_9LAMI|nr:SH2 domain-containing protein A [Sesamum angolense]
MGGFGGVEETGYVLLKNLKVELRRDGDGDDGAEEADGSFALCFWLYIDNCASYPSAILVQKHPDIASSVPFLWLDDKKRLKLFPLLFLHEEAPDPDNSIQWTGIPCASTEIEFPIKKWVHVGCEGSSVCSLVFSVAVTWEAKVGFSVKFRASTFSFQNKFQKLVKLWPLLVGKVVRFDVSVVSCFLLFGSFYTCTTIKQCVYRPYVTGCTLQLVEVNFCVEQNIRSQIISRDPPVRLSIDYSSASEIEEDIDGVWSIVGGKASCRRIFSLDVTLLDPFGCPVNKELEVAAALLYADNKAPVENTIDAEPPLLMSYDGIEYASHERPCKLINGCASFKLKISQLSSKCDNRLFRIRRTASLTWKKSSNRTYYVNGCGSPSPDDGPMELMPSIVREAKPSPSSKRIKLGNDIQFPMFTEELKQANKGQDSHAWTSNGFQVSSPNQDYHDFLELGQCTCDEYRWETRKPVWSENVSSASHNSQATNSDPKIPSVSSPISDLIIFKYCLGGPAERSQLLKEIALLASEEQLTNFAEQVSLFSGCSHHGTQIKIARRLMVEGKQAWASISENNNHVQWEYLVSRINEHYMRIACCSRSLTDQDFECLRRIAGCRDIVSQENFERMWAWLYPVAFTLSQSAVNSMWNSMSPVWMEGFITKEEAELILTGSGGLQDPGTFVLRFPTSRSWPHPDAGNLVVTYVGSDYTIHHRLLSFDFINSSSTTETPVKLLQDLLLEEPELSRLGRALVLQFSFLFALTVSSLATHFQKLNNFNCCAL